MALFFHLSVTQIYLIFQKDVLLMSYKNPYKEILILILCISILSLGLCGCNDSTPHPEDEILAFTLSDDPLTLDPQIASDYSSTMLITNLFEGLVRTDANGEIKSGMAESWDISDDGLTYTFHLYRETKWSNGAEVTANDFVFGLTRALSQTTGSENATDLFLIKNASSYYNGEVSENELGITALDDHTLVIELAYQSNGLLTVLTEPIAMPCNEDFFISTKGKYGKDSDLIITNGPFQIRENYGWDHDKYIYIRRSSGYNAANKAIPLGVNFTYGSQPSDPISSISSGDVDLCEIYGNSLNAARENNFNITTTANTLWGICYNTDIMAFKNAKLRVSLFSSLDRDSLLSDAPSSYVRTSQLIADDVLFAGKNYRKTVGEFTLEQADNVSAMFDKAVQELNDKDIELKSSYTIIYLDDEASSSLVTSIIEEWNETSTCYFNKEPLPRAELEERIKDGDYEIAIAPLNTAVDSPMEFLSSFTSDSPNNYINLNYPAYNDFISAALTGEGDDAINALMDAESYLIDYGYLYPLYYESRYFATAENVSGAMFSTTSQAIDFTQVIKLSED